MVTQADSDHRLSQIITTGLAESWTSRWTNSWTSHRRITASVIHQVGFILGTFISWV